MTLLSRGPYVGLVQSQAFGESKQKKTPFFELKVKIVAKVSPASQEKQQIEPTYRTIQLYWTPKTVDDTKEKLQKAGWPGGDPMTLEPNNPGHFSFVGKEILCWNGKDETQTDQWGDWNLSSARVPEARKSDPSIASRLSAMFGGGQSSAPAPAVPSSFSF